MRTHLKPILALLVLFATAVGNASAESLGDFVPSKLRMDGAAYDTPGGATSYALAPYANGAHYLGHSLTSAAAEGDSQVLSASFRADGLHWVYLATRTASGETGRTYFDLRSGSVGGVAAHAASIESLGGGWYTAAISYPSSDVAEVQFGIAESDGVPSFKWHWSQGGVGFAAPSLVSITSDPVASDPVVSEPTDGDSETTEPVISEPAPLVRAMWVWGSEAVVDTSRRAMLLDFAVEKGINRLFADAWSLLINQPQVLAEFVVESRSRGIEVELLFGTPEWARSEHHGEVLALVDRVIDFAARYPDAKPAGIHLDVEPYLLPEWDQDRNAIANQFLDLFEQVRARAAGAGLLLKTDIPVWYDVHDISRNGEVRPLHELVIDVTDGVGLMDYRDTAERIIADATQELEYASATQKQVVVGVETLCIEPTWITFCEEGSAAMEQVLEHVDSELQQYPAYRGYAVHHFDSYLELSDPMIRAMWVWGSQAVVDATRQSELLDFSSSKELNRLYVGAWSAMVNQPAILADFIVAARERGIDVELLFGQPEWARSERHYEVANIVEQVIDFSARYPHAKPAGIHLDVEPYLLPEWSTERNAIANEFVDLFEKTRERAASAGLALRTDIPIWYDQHAITRNGVSRPLHELMIDATDGVSLMDYRDTKELIIADAASELEYAALTKKDVVVGVETLCIEPTWITFCEEGSAFMEQLLDQIDLDLKQYSSYRGQAIHHFDSYWKMTL